MWWHLPYNVLWIIGFIIILITSILNQKRTAFLEVRAGKEPRRRYLSERWLWYDVTIQCLILITFILIEGQFIYISSNWRTIANFNSNSTTDGFSTLINNIQSQIIGFSRQTDIIIWICGAILSALALFLLTVLPNRVMKGILISVTFHERDVQGIVKNSYQYFKHFIRALFAKDPVLIGGGITITVLFLFIPFLFEIANRAEALKSIVQADQVILALVVFVAWFSPVIMAALESDQTFGNYFTHRLANFLMSVQSHIVVIGYGSLGQRVVDRYVRELRTSSRSKTRRSKKSKSFETVVTPDIQLETLCTDMVIIDKDPLSLVYSATDPLLEQFGVVSSAESIYTSKDVNKNIIHPRERILVPTIIGEIREPFISSRVNLERARLVISTVPEGEGVRTVFDRAAKENIQAIICVSHSDQISYFTYRARHKPIVLVYPKHKMGNTLGHRLWATLLKIRATAKMLDGEWPKILIIGNNKSNRFMIESLWTYLPGNHHQKKRFVQKYFAFIVTTGDDFVQYPVLKQQDIVEAFDLYWPESMVTSGRYPEVFFKVPQATPLRLRARVINEVDTKALVDCLDDFRPHIVLINHNEVEQNSRLLLRCMRATERLKNRIKGFQMPVIMLSAARGDELEDLILGDAIRFYDALARMYEEKVVADHSYPGHARYDHYARKLIGETIIDALATPEEMIIGALHNFNPEPLHPYKPIIGTYYGLFGPDFYRRQTVKELIDKIFKTTIYFPELVYQNLLELQNRVFVTKMGFKTALRNCIQNGLTDLALQPRKADVHQLEVELTKKAKLSSKSREDIKKSPKIIEINSCLPNNAAALPEYMACLSGIEMNTPKWEEFTTYWINNTSHDVKEKNSSAFYLPSFQYVRHIKLDDPLSRAFALTGFAILTPVTEKSPLFNSQSSNNARKSLAVRIFANDGRNYAEPDIDPLESTLESPEDDLIKQRLENFEEPMPPGVPCVIDRVTRRDHEKHNTICEYKKVMFDTQPDGQPGKYACPGMNSCSIAAFQDYISASNNLRLEIGHGAQKLWHARNYSCCTQERVTHAVESDLPTPASSWARIFCCVYGTQKPGEIAEVLNALIFKHKLCNLKPKGELNEDWVIDIEYLEHKACQNSFFSLTRLLGQFTSIPFSQKDDKSKKKQPELPFPVHLIRILPIGGKKSSEQWYLYAKALQRWFAKVVNVNFKLYWLDKNRHPQSTPPKI